MRPGEELARQQMTDALNRAVGNRLNENTLDKVVRNAAFSLEAEGLVSCIFLPTPRGLVLAQKREGRA